jgi:hypothetical protein
MMKAADVKAAFGAGDGVTNTDSLFYTLAATTKNGQIPDGWQGQFVRITPLGANMWYYFSFNATGTVVINAAADNGGGAPTQGEPVLAGITLNVVVPTAPNNPGNQHVYFIRIGDAAGTGVSMTKASGVPGQNANAGY